MYRQQQQNSSGFGQFNPNIGNQMQAQLGNNSSPKYTGAKGNKYFSGN